MNALPFVLAAAVAFFCGFWASGWMAQRRPNWSRRKRNLAAAAPLPSIILLAALGGATWTVLSGPGTGENMQDLALVVIAVMGLMFAALTFASAFACSAWSNREGSR